MPLTLVQRVIYSPTAAATVHTIAWTSTPTAGNLLVATVSSDAFAWPTSTGWGTPVETVPFAYLGQWSKVAGASESTTFVVQCRDAANGGGALFSDSLAAVLEEWSGQATAPALDKFATSGNAASSTSFSVGPTATTTQADERAFAAAGSSATSGAGSTTYSGWTNSFVEITEVNATGGPPISYLGLAEVGLAATAAVAVAATTAPGRPWGGVLTTFKAASAAADNTARAARFGYFTSQLRPEGWF